MEESALITSGVSNVELAALIGTIVSITVAVFAVWLAMTFYHKGNETLVAIQGQVGTTQELVGTHLSTLVSELAKAPRTTDKLSGILQQALAKIPVQRPDDDRCAQPDGGTLNAKVATRVIAILAIRVADYAGWTNLSLQFIAMSNLGSTPGLNLSARADDTMRAFDPYDYIFGLLSSKGASLPDEIMAYAQQVDEVRQHCVGGEAIARLTEKATS